MAINIDDFKKFAKTVAYNTASRADAENHYNQLIALADHANKLESEVEALKSHNTQQALTLAEIAADVAVLKQAA